MKKLIDECVGCTSMGLSCMGITCPNRNIPVYYCDECGEEMEEVYEVYGEELCEECLKDMFRRDT